jgi:hypothetical protein
MWKMALFTLLATFPTYAFNFTTDFQQGFYWASLPIKIHVEEADEERRDTLQKLAEDAVGEWESRTALSLWSLEEGSTNIIRWSENFAAETKMDPVSVLAVAIRYTTGPYFAKTEIVINGTHPVNHDLSHLLTTITHELGHTMGLDHSGNTLAVMAPTLQDPYRGLHNDDIDGMESVTGETQERQVSRYVSPLAYETVETKDPVGCGTVGVAGNGTNASSIFSLVTGILIGLIRKIIKWVKSLL